MQRKAWPQPSRTSPKSEEEPLAKKQEYQCDKTEIHIGCWGIRHNKQRSKKVQGRNPTSSIEVTVDKNKEKSIQKKEETHGKALSQMELGIFGELSNLGWIVSNIKEEGHGNVSKDEAEKKRVRAGSQLYALPRSISPHLED